MDLQKLKAGFAKIHGEDFEYYVQSYSIVLGRNSKKATVDLDLAGLPSGEGETNAAMNISRSHARIFFDFQVLSFMLEVLGKNGVMVNGVMRPANSPPMPLNSRDLLQIGTKKFYFLLPAPLKPTAAEMLAQTTVGGGGGGSKRRRSKAPGDLGISAPPAKQRMLSPEASEKAGQMDRGPKMEASEVVVKEEKVDKVEGGVNQGWVGNIGKPVDGERGQPQGQKEQYISSSPLNLYLQKVEKQEQVP